MLSKQALAESFHLGFLAEHFHSCIFPVFFLVEISAKPILIKLLQDIPSLIFDILMGSIEHCSSKEFKPYD